VLSKTHTYTLLKGANKKKTRVNGWMQHFKRAWEFVTCVNFTQRKRDYYMKSASYQNRVRFYWEKMIFNIGTTPAEWGATGSAFFP
jgi:hypothetical protein